MRDHDLVELNRRTLRRWLADSMLHRTGAAVRIWGLVLVLAVYTALLYVVEKRWELHLIPVQGNFYALLGAVLSLLLVFRTNTAYDRWWEGRKLWGQLINDSRNLAAKIGLYPRIPVEEQRTAGRYIVAFAYALKNHLRGPVAIEKLPGMEDVVDRPDHVPVYIADRLIALLQQWSGDGRITGFELLLLDRHVSPLLDICGACERIRKTPISPSYVSFVRQSIFLYLATMPWAIIDDYGLFTIPTMALVGYFMIGLEMLAEDVEEPFGFDYDDLPLEDFCLTVGKSVEQLLPAAKDGATV